MKTSELAALPGQDRLAALDAIIESAETMNGQSTKFLKEKIQEFELRYEMSSAQLLEAFAKGTVRETAEIAQWLFWIDTLEANAR
ncbi:MAG: hypothetical protein HGB22_10465 [Chlorobiaceae bacterium]|nr:hypothetical protein [Chlorobiaceae bacterium]